MVTLLVGHITFLDQKLDGEHKAIIHKLNVLKRFKTSEKAETEGERMLEEGGGESYLIPEAYGGVIAFDADAPRTQEVRIEVVAEVSIAIPPHVLENYTRSALGMSTLIENISEVNVKEEAEIYGNK